MDDTIPLLKNKAARHATTRVASGEASDESSGCLPGNFRAVSEQLPGNISRNTDECPRNGWRNCPEVSWQLLVKSTQQVTKQVAWQTRSGQVGVREAVRATTRVMSGNASAQYPAQLPGNCRESAGQCPGNISCGVPRIIHAVSNESSECLPGNSRAVSGQCPGNVHAIATLQSARHPRNVRKPDQSMSVSSP